MLFAMFLLMVSQCIVFVSYKFNEISNVLLYSLFSIYTQFSVNCMKQVC